MKIRVYQINVERDSKRLRYSSLFEFKALAGREWVESNIYDMVWEAEVEDDLESVYSMLNGRYRPEGYHGRSLSVSDVIEVIESESIKTGYYYVDNIGFKRIVFKEGEEENG